MTTCLILAAGEAERHNGGNKPLLEVNGETLLSRTCRLVQPHCQCFWIVTHRTDMEDWQPLCVNPKNRRWIVETLVSSMSLWSNTGSTTILLGDVFYTQFAIDMVFGTLQKITAFGHGCNIHAVRWFVDDNSYVSKRLSAERDYAEKHPRRHGAGKLWHWINCDPEIKVYDFCDETTDFDSPQEHKRFIAKYGNRNLRTTAEASKAR